MARMIDQIRASKLPSSVMQFAARGALQVPAAENIEILVHLALDNKVFGELARMTLAGWDENACLAATADPESPRQVLDYFISPDHLRLRLLPALLENPSIPEAQVIKLATSAMRDTIEIILKSKRASALPGVVNALRSNPYLKDEAEQLGNPPRPVSSATSPAVHQPSPERAPATESTVSSLAVSTASAVLSSEQSAHPDASAPEDEEAVIVYLKQHAADIAADGEKPFQAIGGVVELPGQEYFPPVEAAEIPRPAASTAPATSAAPKPAVDQRAAAHPRPHEAKRENTLQKINRLDVKGRIQLALKGNKEERSILIRDGTKVVALAVLEAPKLSDSEVEKFASQKNVLEAVLRQIPLKRRFMKNYIVVRNLVANPRTPLDLGLGLMKNLLTQDLKNLSNNKEVSETIRKLALKMYKQKLEEANKK